jgi:hypothetical protein
MVSRVLFRTEKERAFSQRLVKSQLRQNLARARKQYIEAKLLAVVNEHPEGIALAEAADSLGVVSVVLGRAARSLLKSSKIRKKIRFNFQY